ncbi:MAG: ABC transporter permease, partial [Anaerolineaceae bacterium]|nr:ABC transporter permease [Anaerolineaceae bacterium]
KSISIPLLSQIPFIGPILFNQNILVYVSVLVSIGLWYFLFRTQKGLELRSVGEYPMTADSLGINTTKMRYWSTIIGGMLIGMAGAYLPMVYAGTFTEGMTMGRGWLAIALTFFGGWSPLPILYGSLFFSAVEVLAFRVQVIGSFLPYQILQMFPYIATILVMILTFKRSRVPGFLGNNYDREKRSL